MRSLDTNLLMRLAMQDDEQQLAIVHQVMSTPCWIGVTVILESWWVLTRIGNFTAAEAAAAMAIICAIEQANVQHEDCVLWAAAKAAAGADFADMLHLALSGGADAFTTFDKGIAAFADGSAVLVETL